MEKATEICQENTLVIANTIFQQHRIKLYKLTSPGDQYQNQIDYLQLSSSVISDSLWPHESNKLGLPVHHKLL